MTPHLSSRRAAKVAGSCALHLGQRQAFPLAIADLAQPVVERVIVRAAVPSAPRTSSMVVRARPSGLDDVAAALRLAWPSRAIRSARMPPAVTAWLRPRSLSGMSCVPWKRPSAFHAVSPWRM